MILRGNVFSNTLEMDTGIAVLIPNSFKENNKYQVAYLLHGLCGNNGTWLDYSMLPVYASEYNTIFVMPEVARSFYTDMKYGQKFFTYITEELPKICKSVFNISSKREDTAIIGASMGGHGALKCALSKPDQYAYCCAFSSPCLFLKEGLDNQRLYGHTEEFRAMYGERVINDFEAIFGEQLEWSPNNEILELAKNVSKQELRPRIYTACGTEDLFRADNQRFSEEIKNLNLECLYEEWAGNHSFYFFDEALKKALEFIYKGK